MNVSFQAQLIAVFTGIQMILWGEWYLFPTNWEQRQSSCSEGALFSPANDHKVNIHLLTVLTTKSAENIPSSHHHSFPLQRWYNGIVKIWSGGRQKLSPLFPASVVFCFSQEVFWARLLFPDLPVWISERSGPRWARRSGSHPSQ